MYLRQRRPGKTRPMRPPTHPRAMYLRERRMGGKRPQYREARLVDASLHHQSPATNHQPSVISHQPSSAITHQPTVTRRPRGPHHHKYPGDGVWLVMHRPPSVTVPVPYIIAPITIQRCQLNQYCPRGQPACLVSRRALFLLNTAP